ncbi:hypothetical protein F4778DRAFT_302494 [Xylariomycetidae sp. FL2044]|nr:hypothetical protein F4778DRAFT_302494 [Xylariomycetidae sp. FL2044]
MAYWSWLSKSTPRAAPPPASFPRPRNSGLGLRDVLIIGLSLATPFLMAQYRLWLYHESIFDSLSRWISGRRISGQRSKLRALEAKLAEKQITLAIQEEARKEEEKLVHREIKLLKWEEDLVSREEALCLREAELAAGARRKLWGDDKLTQESMEDLEVALNHREEELMGREVDLMERREACICQMEARGK